MKHSVLCGIDRTSELQALVGGKKTALLTAASGITKEGIPSYEILSRISDLRLLFAPEHGLASAMQDGAFSGEDGVLHPETGAKLYDITAIHKSGRLPELLREVDVAVYDIQDVGARFYTYLCNLTQLMRAAKEAGKSVLVLDRPNPISNTLCEGLILDETRFSSFVGEYAIPTRYGLTVGEYARYVNAEKGIGCDLTVLTCTGWNADLYYDETDLLWVNPSPNIPTVNCAINYIGSCIYEATNLSEGRGTTRPFDWLGAPFVDEKKLLADMNALCLPGVTFRAMTFTPMYNKHAGTTCRGVELHITDRNAYRPLETMLHMFRHFKKYPEFEMKQNGLALRLGQDILCGDYDPTRVLSENREALKNYCEIVEKYRLYS
ncbi:MAG: DUF1343 domain-containing protein [Clostridia bacterium]|nr:DUF1343 domain-containing protein [Clostridia bacterium]